MNDDDTLVTTPRPLFELQNRKTGDHYRISDKATVGRSKDCDIELADKHISRLHATFQVSRGALLLTDEGSENGTQVNNIRIRETLLRENDVVKFHSHEFVVVELNKKKADTLVIEPEEEEEDIAATLIQVPPRTPKPATPTAPTTPPAAELKTTKDQLGHQETRRMDVKDIEEEPKVTDTVQYQAAPALAKAQAQNRRRQAPPSSSASGSYQIEEEDDEGIIPPDESGLTQLEMRSTDSVTVIDAPSESSLDQSQQNLDEFTCIFGYHPSIYDEIYPLNKEVILIGKSDEADIVIQDTSISSKHAEIFWQDEQWLIEDLESTNGTFINGQQINQVSLLQYGDILQCGLIQLVFGQPEPGGAVDNSGSNLWKGITAGLALLVGLALLFVFLEQ